MLRFKAYFSFFVCVLTWGVCTGNKSKVKYHGMVIFMALEMLLAYNCVTEIYGELSNSEKQ